METTNAEEIWLTQSPAGCLSLRDDSMQEDKGADGDVLVFPERH